MPNRYSSPNDGTPPDANAAGDTRAAMTNGHSHPQDLDPLIAEHLAALRQANADLAEAQRIAGFGSWSLDLTTRQMQWSAETYRMFGLAHADFTPTIETFLAAVHPADRALVEQANTDVIAGRRPLDFEFRVVLPEGLVRVVHQRGYVSFDETGRPVRLFGIVHDITAAKAAETAVRQANERLAAIVQASPLAILVLDPGGKVEIWNPAAEKTLGWRAEEVVGKMLPDMSLPDDDDYSRMVQQILRGEAFSGLEIRGSSKDGRVIDASISFAPMRDETGVMTGIVGVVADITERKQTELRVRRLNQELEARVAERTAHLEAEIAEHARAEAEIKALNATLAEQARRLAATNRELETFTYSVSHDLKAPLRGIDGYSRLLLEDYGDQLNEEGVFFITTIRSATQTMAKLIDDLLAYSRLERRQITLGQVDLAVLLTPLLPQPLIDRTYPNIQVSVNLDVPQVNADPDALTIVLRNLIDNALKFSAHRESPQLEIRSHRSAAGCVISIRDNGVGFDMQYHDRIFDIFQRLHRAEDYPGTGVGLAIVRKAIQRMGGRVWAQSQVGQGSTFFVEVPV